MPIREDYRPSSTEIWERAEIVQWMSAMEWPEELMDSIMLDDDPPTYIVRCLVWRHGPIKARNLLLSIMGGSCSDGD